MKPIRPFVLAILDGWGIADPGPSNAISIASTPNIDRLCANYPSTLLQAYGKSVGLTEGVAGNSEVGHLNIGAGYVVDQSETLISKSIEDKTFFSNTILHEAIGRVKARNSSLHIAGLAGPGFVHSRIEHLWAILQMCQDLRVASVYVHLFSDGRDASPSWMSKNADAVQNKIESYGATLASVCGRYYAMDRDNRWDRTQKSYDLMTMKAGQHADTLKEAVESSYANNPSDEFITPTVIGAGKRVGANDVVIMFNYRPDRARQLCQALTISELDKFDRKVIPDWDVYTFTSYQDGLPVSGVAFPQRTIKYPLAKVLSDHGITQLHAAESEKYAHVTYFLNGGTEDAYPGEDRFLVPSPKVSTYDKQPEMSAFELTKGVCTSIESQKYDAFIVNYANPDMVAHTGNLMATVKAIEVVDQCIGRLFDAISKIDGFLVITADHGNAEVLVADSGEMDTQHNSGVVPLIIAGDELDADLVEGSLSNVAPTLLDVLNISKPKDMTAKSLWRPRS